MVKTQFSEVLPLRLRGIEIRCMPIRRYLYYILRVMSKRILTRHCLSTLTVVLALSYGGRLATGHTGAINLFVDPNNNQLYPLETFAMGQFVEYLGTEISVDGPGFIINFPANGVQPGADLSLDIVQDLYYWDGSGLADTNVLFRLRAQSLTTRAFSMIHLCPSI